MIPKKIFIVPYRERVQQKFFFSTHMINTVLKNTNDYEIYFSHQTDERPFNRGATKNIGFMAMKAKYPNDYKNITFIFNDVDTLPFTNLFSYDTSHGTVAHYYGFTYALGGIVVIKGGDFEKINGYPCYWGWGNEDNCLQTRCIRYGINIDRTHFYRIGNPNMLQLFDGISRLINKTDAWRSVNDNGNDGISSITGLEYTIDTTSDNVNDNIYVVHSNRIGYVNIQRFTPFLSSTETFHKYDLREPPIRIIQPNQLDIIIPNEKEDGSNNTINSMNDWTVIPTYSEKSNKYTNKPSKYIPLTKNITSQGDSFIKKSENIQSPMLPNPLVRAFRNTGKKQLLFV